jgi:serine/threonine protein phosphatase PrpC
MPTVSSDEAPRVRLDAVMVTDVGVVRDHNEDAAHIDGRRAFFIVADGMGGHAAGEVASAMAVETVRKSLETARPTIDAFAKHPSDPGRRDLVQLLQNSVLSAHQAVYQRGSRESDKQGMGTTLDVVLVAGPEAFVAHVGDSRAYLIRDGRCAQITTDHTVAEVLVIEGKLSIEEAQVSPLRTILVNAIGVSADVGVEMAHLQLRPGDRLLLCSDGLHDYFVTEQEIADKLSGSDPNGALSEMVEMAKDRGGHDNITGVLVNVLEVSVREGIPGEIEHDETMPVDLSKPNKAEWSDDEETQNLSPREISGRPPDLADLKRDLKKDLETDVTLEAPAVRPPPRTRSGSVPPKDKAKPAKSETADAKAPEPSDAAKPDAAAAPGGDAKTDTEATPPAKPAAKPDTAPETKVEAAPDAKAEPDGKAAAPPSPAAPSSPAAKVAEAAQSKASPTDNRTTTPMRVIRSVPGERPATDPPQDGADKPANDADPNRRDK